MPTVMADISALFLGLQGRLCKAASTMATRGVGLMPLWGKNGVGCAMAYVGLVVGRQHNTSAVAALNRQALFAAW